MMMPLSRRTDERIGSHWDRRTKQVGPDRTKWWQSRAVRRHINFLVSGMALEGTGEGWVHEVRRQLEGRTLERAVSVGSGIGNKEMRFVKLGMVRRFDLFELSSARIEKGQELARSLGLEDRVFFHKGNAFEVIGEESVDLVHWNNSLHHMLNVRAAVEWSRKVLVPGGVFFLDDYVGPCRFQWSEEALKVATGIRALLPRRMLRNPHSSKKDEYLPIQVARPNARAIAKEDPSEAVDSEAILPAVEELFPNVEIRLTGGLVYFLALANILHNIDENDAEGLSLLRLLLKIDEACLNNSQLESPYAVGLGFKE